MEEGSPNRREGAPDQSTRTGIWVGNLATPPISYIPAWWDQYSRIVPFSSEADPLSALSLHLYEKDVIMVNYSRAQDLPDIMSME